MAIGFFGYLLAENIANGLFGAAIMERRRQARIKQALGKWQTGPEPTPVADKVLTRLAGRPETEQEKKQAELVTKLARNIVNRKAFDLAVQGAINRNSKLRRMLPSVKLIRNGQVAKGLRQIRQIYKGA